MRVRGIGRLQRAAEKVRRRFASRAVILLYHRVAELNSDPWELAVTPAHFAEHLEVLRELYRPMPLGKLIAQYQQRRFSRHRVVVTFDDGYADNLHHAKPVLKRFNVPATVFVATGYVEQNGETWWDALDRVLLQPGVLPELLRLRIGGSVQQWNLDEAVLYTEHDARTNRGWSAWRDTDPGPRQRLYRELYFLLQPLAAEERQNVITELAMWAGADGGTHRSTHRFLTREELCTLSRDALIEIGAHTVTHPLLAALPLATQRQEIQDSKIRLEKMLARPVNSFAYPYGGTNSYTPATMAVVRDAGFACACSTFADRVRRNADLYSLPRLYVHDWDGEEFVRRLSARLHA